MCRQLEIRTKFFLPSFGSSWIELLEVPLEMMFLTYDNNIIVAESIKNRLKRVQKFYKKSIAPELSSFSSITIILIWFFRQFDQNQSVVNYFYFLKYT
jgi:hypothetical protein